MTKLFIMIFYLIIMSNQLKKIPKFKNKNQERDFWQKHDSTEYIDWSKAKLATFPNLKPSVKSINPLKVTHK